MKYAKSIPALVSIALVPLCAATAPAKSSQTGKAPAGYVILEEEVTYELPENYPDQPMQSARKSLNKKDLKAAAKDTRKAESYLKGELSRSGPKSDSALTASIAELEKIASSLEAGTSILEKDLSQAFARAHLALAENDQEKAAEHFAAKANDKAGEEMNSSANHVSKASDWSGNKLESAAKTVLRKSSELSGKLMKGASMVPDEVGKGLEALGSEIDRLGQKLEKKKPEAEGSASR
jgi:hypothetical protein